MSSDYNSDQIKVLTDREHVRLRTQVYLGNMTNVDYEIPTFVNGKFEIHKCNFVPAVFKCLGEVADNSIDELTQNNLPTKQIDFVANPVNGFYCISDTGRGIPITMHETGKYTPEVALGSLRAGRNFDEKQTGVIGQNGVGASCVNYCSTSFIVNIHRDNKNYQQVFTNGADNILEPKIVTKRQKNTGTSIQFELDPQVFKNGVSLPTVLVQSRVMEIAFNNPSMTTTYTEVDDFGNNVCSQQYNFPKGFESIVSSFSKSYAVFSGEDMDFFVIFDVHQGIDEKMFTWVNSSLLFDGGICNTQFMNAFTESVIAHLEPKTKKSKIVVTKNDIRENLLIFGIIKCQDPEYDSQSKTRLTGPNMRNKIQKVITDKWKLFAKKQTEWLDVVLERATKRYKNAADDKAAKDLVKTSTKKIPGLLNANSRNRSECILIVTEGDSASNQITSVRDPNTMGIFPLTGKVNNVYGYSVSDILNMVKIKNLIAAIGLVPGKRAVRAQLNFNQVWITTDADSDGDDITTLLVNIFYQLWPELLDPGAATPFLSRLTAPNIVAYKGSKRVHFTNRAEFDKHSSKYEGYTIEYFKGLGSMWLEDWKMVMKNKTGLIPIYDDGHMGSTLELLFGPSVEMRQLWLQGK